MKVARSLARNTAALAMSCGPPERGQGVRRRAFSAAPGPSASPGAPVTILPGEMQLQTMRLLA